LTSLRPLSLDIACSTLLDTLSIRLKIGLTKFTCDILYTFGGVCKLPYSLEMFYIDKTYRSLRQHGLTRLHVAPTIVVFVAFFGLTIWSTISAQRTQQQKKDQALNMFTAQTAESITGRMQKYEEVLRAGSGLFNASDAVTRSEWKQFTDVFELPVRYPGAQGIGFAQVVKQQDLQASTDQIRQQGSPDFTLTPEGNRPVYAPIVFNESQTGDKHRAPGFDMYSDPARHAAMDNARDSGKASVTEPLVLVQDQQTNRQPGFVMCLPVYMRSSISANQAERRQNIVGFIYVTFRSQELLKYIDTNQDTSYGFRIYAAEADTSTPYYESQYYKDVNNDKSVTSHSQRITVANKKWTIVTKIKSNSATITEQNRPASVFWGGLVLSIVMAGFIYLLLLNRMRDLAFKEQQDIKIAKDELLALASHQLRTPATGVKQYIGLLRDGYAGKLTKEQMLYVDKAYSSNERQLGTINEMLTVARADAGNFELRKSPFNLVSLVKDVIDEQIGAIKERGQVLEPILPSKDLIINADEKYIRMAIENLISNATKYTAELGTVSVKVAQKATNAVVSVSDTGVGVSEKDFPLLFLKFSRIPNELTGKVSGSGIGLYLAKTIVESSGGSITFTSKLGVGSTCTLTLPVQKK
jgi:signal transduction histidine kinase